MTQSNPQPRKPQNKNRNAPSPFGGEGSAVSAVSENLLRNIPPHSVEAEQAVLGGVFLKPDSLYSIVDILQEEDFYLPAHRMIFAAFLALFSRNAPIDLITVAEHLKSQSRLEEANGAVYLTELAGSIISAANAEYYANIVRDKSLARGLISACAEIISDSYEPAQDVRELLSETEQKIFTISQRSTSKTYATSRELTERVFAQIEARSKNNSSVTGVRTNYTDLDRMTAGLQPSDLIILAARPSMGKTAFALNLAMRAAIRESVPVVIYSLEMSMDQLLMRMLCAWGKVDLSRLMRNRLEDSDWTNLIDASSHFKNAPIYIDDTPSLTPLDMRARTRRLKMEKGVGLVIVDYLQLMRSARRTDSRELEISDISRNLKAMAKELNVPVIALSQLNRKVEERKDKRPLLSDLRESGAIEQDADIIMFIHREAAHMNPADRPPIDDAEIIIGKQRNGPVGSFTLRYASAFTAFENPIDYVGGPQDL